MASDITPPQPTTEVSQPTAEVVDASLKFLPTWGFRGAPVCKLWAALVAISFIGIVTGFHPSYHEEYDTLWQVLGLIIPYTANEHFACLMLIYIFRIIERRFGTAKFFVFTLFVTVTATALDVICSAVIWGSPRISTPFSLLVGIFVQMLLEVSTLPSVLVFELIPASEHHIALIFLISLFTPYGLAHIVFPSATASILYRKFLIDYIPPLPVTVPSVVFKWIDDFEGFLEPKGVRVLPIAATLERQRIEEEDEAERRIIRSEIRQFAPPPSEDLIQTLVNDLGFTDRSAVVAALMEAGNNVEVAADLLLRQQLRAE